MNRCAECIINDVARAFGVTPTMITGPYKQRLAMRPRAAVYRLLRDKGLSSPQIGRMVGGRDHTSVLSGLERAAVWLRTDHDFAARYARAS